MILWKHVVSTAPRYGFLTVLALGMAAWPASSAGQTPAHLEERLQRIEAALELILSRPSRGEGNAEQDPNRSPGAGGQKSSMLRLLTGQPTTEFTSGEGAILDVADRRYGIVRENGRPALQAVEPFSGRLIWQSDLGTALSVGDKAIWQLSRTEDGKLLRVEAASEDAGLAFTIDAETGRTVKQEIVGNSIPQVTVVGPRRVPLVSGRYAVSAALRSTPPAASGAGTPQGELVVLATSYVDAIGNVKLARSKYEQLKGQRNSTAAAPRELEAAAIHLETAQQKAAVLTAAIQAAHETALAELDYAERLYMTGFLMPNQLIALQAKVKTLEAIVRSGAGTRPQR